MDNVDVAIEEFNKINIPLAKRNAIIVEVAVDRAVYFVAYATVYLKLFHEMVKKEAELAADGLNINPTFKSLLLKRCRELFRNEVLQTQIRNQTKHLGIIRLIGILFKYNLLSSFVLKSVFDDLIAIGTADKLECVYELLALVGKHVEFQSGSDAMDVQWYNKPTNKKTREILC